MSLPPTALTGIGVGETPILLTEAEWAARMREDYDVPDKSYRRFELGQEVGHFLRAKRMEAAPLTIVSYEPTLRLLVLDYRDKTLADFEGGAGLDMLHSFLIRHWGDAERSTIDQRKSALRSFFAWAEDTDRIVRNPARKLKGGKRSKRAKRRAHAQADIQRIAAAQDTIAHEAFVLIMGRLGLRKMEAGSLRARDIDLKHDVIYLADTKSGEPVEVPIVYEDVRVALSLWLAGDPSGPSRSTRHPDEYLIAPRSHPRRKPDQATVHRRFKKCLERAGVEDFPMHELRHSAADHVHRATGDLVAASKLLRHSSVKVTEDYLHPTQDDLRRRMRQADR